MTPSLYDLLDVEPDATEDQIRTAWKSAIADLEPSDRRFRAYNDAAATLLDPARRARHDADLAADRDEAETDEAETDEAETEVEGPGVSKATSFRPASARTSTAGDVTGARTSTAGSEAEVAQADEGGSGGSRFTTPPPAGLVIGAAVVSVIALALALWGATWSSTFADAPADADDLAAARESALENADRIATEALAYDYRQMDEAGIAEKQRLMAPSYAEQYAQVIAELRPAAKAQESVVTIEVQGSGLAGLSPDGNQARVVVFADQLVAEGGRQTERLRQTATLRLIRDSVDSPWLLEMVCTQDLECDAAAGPGSEQGSEEPAPEESSAPATQEPSGEPTDEPTGSSSGAPAT